MIFKKLKRAKEKLDQTKRAINSNMDIDIDVDSIILQLLSPIEDENDIEYIKNTYIDRHKYESFSMDKICLELNFIMPILQVYYKEFNINRASFIILNNKYLLLLKDYKFAKNNQERMVILIYMKLLLEFIKDNIIFKNVNYMFELRNKLHMLCDKDIFRRWFTNPDPTILSTEKKILLNIIINYEFYSLESLEYIIKNNICINMYGDCVKLLDSYLYKFINSYDRINIKKYHTESLRNITRLSLLFNNKDFISKIKRYKLYYKKFKRVLANTNINNNKSLNKIFDYNYKYQITNIIVLNEINDITNPSSKDIKILEIMKDFY